MLADDGLTAGSKADFSAIYDRPDPRAYVRTLHALDYQVPQQALPVFETVLRAMGAGAARPVLDVCCSYGINAALLRCGVDLEQMHARYADPALTGLSPDELARADADFYAGRLTQPDRRVVGLDAARAPVDYALEVGLLDRGWAEDLESDEPSAGLAAGLADVGLVICTGGVGYVGPATFERILQSVRRPDELWLAVFVLRVFDYSAIAATCARYGLVTERLPGLTFAQRRFADQGERDAAYRDVTRRGLDPSGKEAAGWYHADCFLTRPPAAVQEIPVGDIVQTLLRWTPAGAGGAGARGQVQG